MVKCRFLPAAFPRVGEGAEVVAGLAVEVNILGGRTGDLQNCPRKRCSDHGCLQEINGRQADRNHHTSFLAEGLSHSTHVAAARRCDIAC